MKRGQTVNYSSGLSCVSKKRKAFVNMMQERQKDVGDIASSVTVMNTWSGGQTEI